MCAPHPLFYTERMGSHVGLAGGLTLQLSPSGKFLEATADVHTRGLAGLVVLGYGVALHDAPWRVARQQRRNLRVGHGEVERLRAAPSPIAVLVLADVGDRLFLTINFQKLRHVRPPFY